MRLFKSLAIASFLAFPLTAMGAPEAKPATVAPIATASAKTTVRKTSAKHNAAKKISHKKNNKKTVKDQASVSTAPAAAK